MLKFETEMRMYIYITCRILKKGEYYIGQVKPVLYQIHIFDLYLKSISQDTIWKRKDLTLSHGKLDTENKRQ